VFRYFRDRDLPKIFEIAEKVKAEVDVFKPIVPLAVALRKDGMQERHWQALSEATGIEIAPDDDFTLQVVIDKGMGKFVTECEDIGEKAYKENYIEKSLKKMKLDWEGLNFMTPEFKSTRTYIIAGFDDAAAILDEHIVTG
jgi:dynein heavy chain, axonemal